MERDGRDRVFLTAGRGHPAIGFGRTDTRQYDRTGRHGPIFQRQECASPDADRGDWRSSNRPQRDHRTETDESAARPVRIDGVTRPADSAEYRNVSDEPYRPGTF